MDDEIYIYIRRVLDFHREFSHNETLFVELLLPSFGKYELSFIIKTGVNRARFSKTKGGGEGGDKLCRRLNDETAVIDEREGGREGERRQNSKVDYWDCTWRVLTDCSARPPCSVDSEAPGRTPPPPPPRVPGRSARCPNYHKLQQSQWTFVRGERSAGKWEEMKNV